MSSKTEKHKDDVLNWLAGEHSRGMSARAMVFASLGIGNGKSHPHDPSDFNRCLNMLKDVPAVKEHFDKVGALSPTWKALISRWDDIEKQFIDEVGEDWKQRDKSATLTYNLMADIIGKSQIKT